MYAVAVMIKLAWHSIGLKKVVGTVDMTVGQIWTLSLSVNSKRAHYT